MSLTKSDREFFTDLVKAVKGDIINELSEYLKPWHTRLENIEMLLKDIKAKVDGHHERITALERRVDTIEKRLRQIDGD